MEEWIKRNRNGLWKMILNMNASTSCHSFSAYTTERNENIVQQVYNLNLLNDNDKN